MLNWLYKMIYNTTNTTKAQSTSAMSIDSLGVSLDFFNENGHLNNSTLISIINKIHQDVINSKLSGSKKTKRVFSKPDILSDYSNLMYKIVQDFFIKGNAIVLIKKQRNYFGLENLNPDLISINTLNGTPLYVEQNTNNVYNSKNIIHLRKNSGNYESYFSGTSLVSYLKDEITNLNTFNKSIANHLKYSSPVIGILSAKTTSSGLAETNASQRIVDKLNVAEGTPLIQIPDNFEFKDTNEKSQIFKMREYLNTILEQKIYSFFNISKNIVDGNATEQETNNYHNNLLIPFLKYLSNSFSNKLKTEINWKYEPNVKWVKLFELGIITTNEYRAKIGLEKYSHKNADKLYRDLNHVSIETIDDYQRTKNEDNKKKPKKENEKS